jgi:hypothetical protein
LNEQSHNPLALVEEVAPKVKKTAKEVIANTTKENAEKWIQDQSEDEDTPEPDSTLVNPVSEVKDEVMEEVAVAEAREEGVVADTPLNETVDKSSVIKEDDDDDDDLEEVVPAPRSIRLRVTKPKSEPEIPAETSRPRRGKRKAPTPEEGNTPPPARKGRSIKIKSTPTSASTPTRSLRSRAPKTEEKQQADRAARARIRAALSEDVDVEDEEDIDMDM